MQITSQGSLARFSHNMAVQVDMLRVSNRIGPEGCRYLSTANWKELRYLGLSNDYWR